MSDLGRAIRLEIPLPPSVNGLFVNAWGNRRGKTKAYAAWCEECDLVVTAQKPTPLRPPVSITLTIYGGKGFPVNADIANRGKAAEDAVVRAGIVPDDDVRNVVRTVQQYYPPQGKGDVARAVVLVQEVGQ